MRVSLVMTDPGVGGVQQSVVHYAETLLEQRHDVQPIVASTSPLRPDLEALGLSPARVHAPRSLRLLYPLHIAEIRRHLRRFNPDVVLGFGHKGYREARRAAGRSVPVVTRNGAMKPETIRQLLDADALILTSEEMRSLALELGATPQTTYVLANFLTGATRTPSFRETGSLRIGALGRMVHRKGFDTLIEAAARLRAEGHSFDLVLGGDGTAAIELRALADRLHVPVELPGWVSNADKAEFFDRVDIFVCPSRDEPFGYVFLEAMQAGLPIVATDTVGARAVLTPGSDGLVGPVGDAAQMAANLSRLLIDASVRRELASAGQATLLSRFHSAVAGPHLTEILSAARGRFAATNPGRTASPR